MRWDHLARHCAIVSCSLVAPSALADFTFVDDPPPNEPSQAQILSVLYGGTFVRSGAVDFSNGSILAQRVQDFDAQGSSPSMNMSTPTAGFDEFWLPNFDHATATLRTASFADFDQIFGYFEGDGLTDMLTRTLFTIPAFTNNYLDRAVAMPQFPDDTTIRWGRDGGMPPRLLSSQMAMNPASKDHMVTYEIVDPGIGPGGPRTWVLFWEDLQFDKPILDDDFNDLVVEVVADALEGEQWALNGGGAWNVGGNWTSGIFPNGDDKIAHFGDVITSDATITLTSPVTVNGVRLNSTGHRYTFVDATLNLAGQGIAFPHVRAEQGSHTFRNDVHILSAPIPSGGDSAVATLSVSRTADVLRFEGNFTVNPALPLTLFKVGQGEVEVKKLRSDTTLNLVVERGTMRFSSDGGTSRLDQLFFVLNTAKLDITDNALVLDHDGGSPLNDLRSRIISGYNGGSWDGAGIISSVANDTTHAIGYAENNGSASGVSFTMFGVSGDLIPVDNTAVLLRHTRYGDANLDGLVNNQDFNRLATHFGAGGLKLWAEGDFNYDGTVNIRDFNLLAANFGMSAGIDGMISPEEWATLFSATPEPSLLAPVGVALLGLRRTRGHGRRGR